MNYQLECDRIIDETGNGTSLLLHSCCAPCSSYVLVYLRKYFRVTVLYYNPNIASREEYEHRKSEELRLIDILNKEREDGTAEGEVYPIGFLDCDHGPEDFLRIAKGREFCPEGGERCLKCYELRMGRTAEEAKKGGFDLFATTLTVSPLKKAEALNTIGLKLQEKYGVRYLVSDFKKRDGYLTSIRMSEKHCLYRQCFCGCAYSLRDRMLKEKEKELQNAASGQMKDKGEFDG